MDKWLLARYAVPDVQDTGDEVYRTAEEGVEDRLNSDGKKYFMMLTDQKCFAWPVRIHTA